MPPESRGKVNLIVTEGLDILSEDVRVSEAAERKLLLRE